jgi:hypothetical protein
MRAAVAASYAGAPLARGTALPPGVRAGELTGDLSQPAREAALADFRSGALQVLFATDVAARGIDVPAVDAVLHHRLPREMEAFVHRSGRTARAGLAGAVNLNDESGAEDKLVVCYNRTVSRTTPLLLPAAKASAGSAAAAVAPAAPATASAAATSTATLLTTLYGRLVGHLEREEEVQEGVAWLTTRVLQLQAYVSELEEALGRHGLEINSTTE